MTSCPWDPGLACGKGTRVGRAATVRVHAGLILRRNGASSLLSVSFVEAVPHCVVLAGLDCVVFLFFVFLCEWFCFLSFVCLFCIIWNTFPLLLLARHTTKHTRSQPFTTFKSKKLTFSREFKMARRGWLVSLRLEVLTQLEN